MSDTEECDCPKCYLLGFNIDICEVYVNLRKKNVSYKAVENPNLSIGQRNAILMLTLHAKNNQKLKVNHTWSFTNPKFEFKVNREDRYNFTFCLHHTEEEAPPIPYPIGEPKAEDPIPPMD